MQIMGVGESWRKEATEAETKNHRQVKYSITPLTDMFRGSDSQACHHPSQECRLLGKKPQFTGEDVS